MKAERAGKELSVAIPSGRCLWKTKATEKAVTTEDSAPLRIKVWVIPPSKEASPAKTLAEDKGNMEWVVERENHRYQIPLLDLLVLPFTCLE